MTKPTALALVLALGCGASRDRAASPPPAPRPHASIDTASHAVRHVAVAPGVTLEVLDFGGAGQPLVLLAGLGHTAHIFDDFAPSLTGHGRVFAITRRGFGSSSAPATGYDLARRVADDLAVLDALSIERAILVGHSIAGGELTALAGTHPERVAALVYLDAAVDQLAIREVMSHAPPEGEPPGPGEADLASPHAFAAFHARLTGLRVPMGEILALFEFEPRGRFKGPRSRLEAAGWIFEQVAHPDYAAVQAPSLVLFAVARGPEDFFPQWNALSPEQQAAWRGFYPAVEKLHRDNRIHVRESLRGAQVVELVGADHALFIAQSRETFEHVSRFLAQVSRRGR